MPYFNKDEEDEEAHGDDDVGDDEKEDVDEEAVVEEVDEVRGGDDAASAASTAVGPEAADARAGAGGTSLDSSTSHHCVNSTPSVPASCAMMGITSSVTLVQATVSTEGRIRMSASINSTFCCKASSSMARLLTA